MELTRADDAERAVIGAMLGRYDSIDIAASIITATDFMDDDLARIFKACVRLRAQGIEDRRIDWLSVVTEAETMRYLHPQDLSKLTRDTPVMGNVGHYALQVKAASTRRAYALAGQRIIDAAFQAPTAADAVTAASAAYTEASTTTARDTVQMLSWEDIRTAPDAPYDWIVPGYLERGDRLVVTGGEGMGKSHFLRQIAVMTASGLNFVTGQPIERKRTLVFDVENNQRQWKRATDDIDRQLRQAGCDPQGWINVVPTGRLNILGDQDLAMILNKIQEASPDLIVIGPLYKLVNGGITNDDDAAPLITVLDNIRDRGITLCMETHMGHTKTGGGERDVRPRGSAALLGWPEFGKGFAPTPLSQEWAGADDAIVEWIPWRGDRDFRPWPRYWSKQGRWPFTPWEPPK